jgi:hypothetical protein
MTRKAWTLEEDEYIKKAYNGKNVEEVAAYLGRTLTSVRQRLHKLGIRYSGLPDGFINDAKKGNNGAYSAWRKVAITVGADSCSPEFLRYSNFKAWYDGLHKEGWCVSAALTNGHYSLNKLCYIPDSIRSFIRAAKTNYSKKGLPQGVYESNGTYRASFNFRGFQGTKSYKTIEEVAEAYKAFKMEKKAEIAESLLNCGEIDDEMYQAIIGLQL